MGAALDAKTWDLVISDWSMPKFSAPAALAMLQGRALDLPFIIVSGTVGEDKAVAAMRAGAHDYVLKDNLGRLSPAVERELRECNDRRAHRKVEAALHETEQRFRRLAESGVIGIVIADLTGTIHEANDTYLKMLGYSRDELQDGVLRWTDMTPPELAHLGARAVEQLRASGFAPPWETESFHKDGSRVPILIGVALLDRASSIAFTVDLSERKRAEEARERAEGALRQRGAAAAGAEDGGGRPARRRRRPRLQQPAHGDPELRQLILADGPGRRRSDAAATSTRSGWRRERAAELTRQLLAFSRQQVLRAAVLDLERRSVARHGEDAARG